MTPTRRAQATMPVVVAAVAFLCLPGAALACSICRCGDPTFTALGKDVVRDLNGYQEERTVANVGLTYLLGAAAR